MMVLTIKPAVHVDGSEEMRCSVDRTALRLLPLLALSIACRPPARETGHPRDTAPPGASSPTQDSASERSEAPTAGFDVLYAHGVQPFHASFQDLSDPGAAGGELGWSWDFGDGGTSDEQHPVHRYAEAGSYTVSLTVTSAAGSHTHVAEDLILVDAPFEEPWWWHHYHADSRNSDHNGAIEGPDAIEQTWTWPDRDDEEEEAKPVAAFNGAALSENQGTLYITSSWDGGPNFHAIDTETGDEAWSWNLSPWATWSSALVAGDDVVYVSDEVSTVALQPPQGDEKEPTLLWEEPHGDVSMSHGFTPWGEVFEVTLDGEVSVYSRHEEVPGEGTLLARAQLGVQGELPLPPGVGLPLTLQQVIPPSASCVEQDDGAGGSFRVPGQIADLWDAMGEQEILSSDEDGLIAEFWDTCFGGVFVSNSPSIAQLPDPGTGELSEHEARIFVATVGEHHPPFEDMEALQPYLDDDHALLKQLFFSGEEYEDLSDEQLDALVGTILPTETAEGGRYAVNPDPDFACQDGGSPYLYPAFGAPVGEIQDPEAMADETTEDKKAKADAIRQMQSDFYRHTRGYYTGYLQMADWNRTTRELDVRDPAHMDSPSGTSAAVSPAEARSDGQQFLYLASADELWAFDIGAVGEAPPREPQWTWDAGLPVGGSPTVFLPEEADREPGSGAAIAVLAGFEGLVMIQDRSIDDAEAEKLWTRNILPFDERELGFMATRQERYYDGEWVDLAIASSVAEAGDEHIYIAFTSGPAHIDWLTEHQVGTWESELPVRSEFTVVRVADGEFADRVDIDEAPVCDSTLGADQKVYSIHTSGIDQIKAAMYPRLFDEPTGGVVAYGQREGRR